MLIPNKFVIEVLQFIDMKQEIFTASPDLSLNVAMKERHQRGRRSKDDEGK
jgi:hypothetical protein